MDTIFALSSGRTPSGVAVVRLSGERSRFVLETISGFVPAARRASLRRLRSPESGETIDTGICLWFPGPHSFTGEDCAEFHVHGGSAVVRALLDVIGRIEGVKLAEPGEFSRRAFLNGRLDLTEIEGLADLIAADTEMQRRQAVAQSGGALRDRLEEWRGRIVRMQAMVEAGFDFAEEEDVPGDVGEGVWADAGKLAAEIARALDDGKRGEIVRDGFQVVLLGTPNAGKSSLLNAMARREVAIVTEEAGTTRDLIEVHLDLDGYAVTVVDTAGMRETEGLVEREGIRRAMERAISADLVVWLWPVEDAEMPEDAKQYLERGLLIRSKDDRGEHGVRGVSVKREDGVFSLIDAIRSRVAERLDACEPGIVVRARQRMHLENCSGILAEAAAAVDLDTELRAEMLRRAGEEIGRITGRIETEQLLDVIFSEFCIGK